MTKSVEQKRKAFELGQSAHAAGKASACGLDPNFLQMLGGRFIGSTPAGEASTSSLMDAWLDGWHSANAEKAAMRGKL